MISAIVIAKNEEDRVNTCLESIKWADEIIFLDNCSTDKTVELAKKYTKNIISFPDHNFAKMREEAASLAKGDWLLFVDADERVLEPLRNEIQELARGGSFSAYAISRINIIFGSEYKYGPFWPDWVVRFLKKADFKGYVGEVHEYPKFQGNLGYTKNSLLHLTHRDVDQIVLKSLNYSNIDAKLRLEAGHPSITGWRLIRILFTELFNQGIIRRGFFLGTTGVMDSLLQTFSMVITYIRLWQLQQTPGLPEKYQHIDEELIRDEFKYRQ